MRLNVSERWQATLGGQQAAAAVSSLAHQAEHFGLRQAGQAVVVVAAVLRPQRVCGAASRAAEVRGASAPRCRKQASSAGLPSLCCQLTAHHDGGPELAHVNQALHVALAAEVGSCLGGGLATGCTACEQRAWGPSAAAAVASAAHSAPHLRGSPLTWTTSMLQMPCCRSRSRSSSSGVHWWSLNRVTLCPGGSAWSEWSSSSSSSCRGAEEDEEAVLAPWRCTLLHFKQRACDMQG